MLIHQHGFALWKEKLFDPWYNRHVVHHLTQTPQVVQSLMVSNWSLPNGKDL
jgi:hypothetical protein